MKYFYASATMGFDGRGYFHHRLFHFPDFPKVSKTITLNPKKGFPFALVHLGHSTWNHIGLHNKGFHHWISNHYSPNLIVSISGTDLEIQEMCDYLEGYDVAGIELNYSCPNIKNPKNKKVPKSRHKLQLKLNYLQDPYQFDLSNISKISLNSIPAFGGGVSGRFAQKKNWTFIKMFIREGLPIVGCSAVNRADISKLADMGCKEIAIGTMILINPLLVQQLGEKR